MSRKIRRLKILLLRATAVFLALFILLIHTAPVYAQVVEEQEEQATEETAEEQKTEGEQKTQDLLYPFYSDTPQSCGPTATSMSGDDAIAVIFNFLTSKGLTDFQAAGVLGNMQHESGYQPMRLQGTVSGVETPVDSLTPAQLADPQLGYGLVQWTPVLKMINPVRDAGKNPEDIYAQLEFLWDQLEGRAAANEKAAGDHLKATTNVAEATLSFETKYERHAGPPQPDRIVEAERVLQLARSQGLNQSNVSGDVYILGDSITVGANDQYTSKFETKTITPVVSAVSGRSWNTPGNAGGGAVGTQGTGKAAVEADTSRIAGASSIVIALGTNGLECCFSTNRRCRTI
jgi:hypothetical protein